MGRNELHHCCKTLREQVLQVAEDLQRGAFVGAADRLLAAIKESEECPPQKVTVHSERGGTCSK